MNPSTTVGASLASSNGLLAPRISVSIQQVSNGFVITKDWNTTIIAKDNAEVIAALTEIFK